VCQHRVCACCAHMHTCVCVKQFMAGIWQIRRAGQGTRAETVAEVRAGQQRWMAHTASAAFTSLKERNRFICNAQLCEWSYTGVSLLTGLGSHWCQVCCQAEEAAPLVVPGTEISSHIMLLVGFEAVSSVH
jgi:hypothetical protein